MGVVAFNSYLVIATAALLRRAIAREPLDVALALDGALELLAELYNRNIPALVCSMHEEPGYIQRALAAGARGYSTKREAPRDLARAVRDVLEGWLFVSPRAAEGLR